MVSRERIFGERFARFLGLRHGVATCNGSSAILIALQAVGVRVGDEVLVPAMTWIGCASAVLRLGAIPRFVDSTPAGLAMSADAAADAIKERTRAILLVHPYCQSADIEPFLALARSRKVALVEDCSHAHGAFRAGRYLGTFGDVGVFSLQQSKVLTSGEGGAVVTNDEGMYRLLQQYRADGRVYNDDAQAGEMMLSSAEELHGANFTLSELQAAVLIDRLAVLKEENRRRQENASTLNGMLKGLSGLRPIYSEASGDQPPLYRYVVELSGEWLGARDLSWWEHGLSAELQLRVERLYQPLPEARQLQPDRVSTLGGKDRERFRAALQADGSTIPQARRAYRSCLAIPHLALLGSQRDCEDIRDALSKLASFAGLGERSRPGE